MMSLRFLTLFALLLVIASTLHAQSEQDLEKAKEYRKAYLTAIGTEDLAKAEQIATDLIKLGAEQPEVSYRRRAAFYLTQNKYAQAASDLEQLAKLIPTAIHYQQAGETFYFAEKPQAALNCFNEAIKLEPKLEAGHWQRGIVYYDLGQWENGRKQFEQYQGVDDNDVENVVWRAMCMSRDPQLGWAKAAGDLWKVKHDRRVPLMVVHQLFADKATEADVLKAVDEGNPGEEELLSRRFYAHLYRGLYHEVRGNKPEALKHLELASGKYKLPGYMAEVARVHVGMVKKEK